MKKIFTLIAMMVLAIAANATSVDFEAIAADITGADPVVSDIFSFVGNNSKATLTKSGFYTGGNSSATARYIMVEPTSNISLTVEGTASGDNTDRYIFVATAAGADETAANVIGKVAIPEKGTRHSLTCDLTAGQTYYICLHGNGTITAISYEAAGPAPEPKEYTVNASVTYDGDETSKKFENQVVKVLYGTIDSEGKGTCDVTLPAAVAGPCTMDEQTIKDVPFYHDDDDEITEFKLNGFYGKKIIAIKLNGEPVDLILEDAGCYVFDDGTLNFIIIGTDSKNNKYFSVNYKAEGIEIPTAVKNAKAAKAENKVAKFFDGKKVVIVKDGKKYTVAGAQM